MTFTVVYVWYDGITLVQALPEPIENALQGLQFEKKSFYMKVNESAGGDFQPGWNRPQRSVGMEHNCSEENRLS